MTNHMSDWPAVVRTSGLVERVCRHGVGHPDPASLRALDPCGSQMLGVHGCDGCCRPPEPEPLPPALRDELEAILKEDFPTTGMPRFRGILDRLEAFVLERDQRRNEE